MAQELPAKTTSQADLSQGGESGSEVPLRRRRGSRWNAFRGLFVINGVCLCLGETPVLHVLSERKKRLIRGSFSPAVKVFERFNIASASSSRMARGSKVSAPSKAAQAGSPISFADEDPDFVFLSRAIIVQWSISMEMMISRFRPDQAIPAGVMRAPCFFPFRTTVAR